MAYDNSKEKVLSTKEIPFWDNHPEWGGVVLQATQYEEKQPQIVLKQYRVDRTTQEKKIYPFISLPASAVGKVSSALNSLSAYIEQKYPRQQNTNQ